MTLQKGTMRINSVEDYDNNSSSGMVESIYSKISLFFIKYLNVAQKNSVFVLTAYDLTFFPLDWVDAQKI